MRVDVQTGEQRCRHDADEGGDRGDGHRQRHIPFGKKIITLEAVPLATLPTSTIPAESSGGI